MCVGAKSDSFATPWTVAHQAPLSGIFQAEYWNGLPFPPPRDLPNPGICVFCIDRRILITEPPEAAMVTL